MDSVGNGWGGLLDMRGGVDKPDRRVGRKALPPTEQTDAESRRPSGAVGPRSRVLHLVSIERSHARYQAADGFTSVEFYDDEPRSDDELDPEHPMNAAERTTANAGDEQDNVCQVCGDHRPCDCDRDDSPVEFTESPAGERARERWARSYDELNGAPENEEDR